MLYFCYQCLNYSNKFKNVAQYMYEYEWKIYIVKNGVYEKLWLIWCFEYPTWEIHRLSVYASWRYSIHEKHKNVNNFFKNQKQIIRNTVFVGCVRVKYTFLQICFRISRTIQDSVSRQRFWEAHTHDSQCSNINIEKFTYKNIFIFLH